jgi:predicted porin
MRGFRVSSLLWMAALSGLVLAIPAPARADVTLVEKDGWTFYTRGLVAAHYQLVKGDADPDHKNPSGGVASAAGGEIKDSQATSDRSTIPPSITLSNMRSGFIGTQIGFGVNRKINDRVHVESLLAINVAGINSNRGQNLQKDVDYREAWAQVVSPYGSLRFGRMFGIFGEGSAEVMAMAFKYGVGHPCAINVATISCGSSGAGPIYAGFDAAIRYISPRLAGFELAVAVVDPSVSLKDQMSPTPRVDAELNFDQTWNAVSLRVIAQSMYETISTSTAPAGMTPGTVESKTIWGGMGTAIVGVGPIRAGGGGWVGTGVGERVPLEATDGANPIFQDATLELRQFRGYYGNIQAEFMNNFLTAGGGILYVKPTAYDNTSMAQADVLDHQNEFHVTYQHKWDAIVINAEFTHWQSVWHFGAKQKLNFMGAGINYIW